MNDARAQRLGRRREQEMVQEFSADAGGRR